MKFEGDKFWSVVFQSINGIDEIEFKLKLADEFYDVLYLSTINIFNDENAQLEHVTSLYPHM
jgi:hypothetical protein